MNPTYLRRVDGLAATVLPDFDREQWTTGGIHRLGRGDVIALPRKRQPTQPIQPLVLTAVRTEDVPGDVYGLVIGEARHVDTGEFVEFKLRANESVLTRCDLHYA